MNARALALIRCIVAGVWIYEGLYSKILFRLPHEMAVVAPVAPALRLSPAAFLFVIGLGESLLGAAVLSGFCRRPLAWFQAVLLLGMNIGGILWGEGAIAHPLGLIVHNLPFGVCIFLTALRAQERAEP